MKNSSGCTSVMWVTYSRTIATPPRNLTNLFSVHSDKSSNRPAVSCALHGLLASILLDLFESHLNPAQSGVGQGLGGMGPASSQATSLQLHRPDSDYAWSRRRFCWECTANRPVAELQGKRSAARGRRLGRHMASQPVRWFATIPERQERPALFAHCGGVDGECTLPS